MSENTHPKSPSDIEEEYEKKAGSLENFDRFLTQVNQVSAANKPKTDIFQLQNKK